MLASHGACYRRGAAHRCACEASITNFPTGVSFHAGMASSSFLTAACAYSAAARRRALTAASESRSARAFDSAPSNGVPGRSVFPQMLSEER